MARKVIWNAGVKAPNVKVRRRLSRLGPAPGSIHWSPTLEEHDEAPAVTGEVMKAFNNARNIPYHVNMAPAPAFIRDGSGIGTMSIISMAVRVQKFEGYVSYVLPSPFPYPAGVAPEPGLAIGDTVIFSGIVRILEKKLDDGQPLTIDRYKFITSHGCEYVFDPVVLRQVR